MFTRQTVQLLSFTMLPEADCMHAAPKSDITAVTNALKDHAENQNH